MHILLDTKDVINVIEHSSPISIVDLDDYLRAHNANLVITFTSIREIVAPALSSRTFLDIRPILQKIEGLPVVYLREAPIPADEIKAAMDSYIKGGEPSRIDPYVRRWDDTFSWPGPSAAAMFVAYRLDEIVYEIFRQRPEVFRPYRNYGELLRRQFAAERALKPAARKNLRDNFADSIQRREKQWGLNYGCIDVTKFGHWIYDNPCRCPGLRLSYDVYHELRTNLGDAPKDSDIPDFAHINAVPYADLATLDRRMFNYVGSVSKRLNRAVSSIDYHRRTYRNLQDLIAANP